MKHAKSCWPLSLLSLALFGLDQAQGAWLSWAEASAPAPQKHAVMVLGCVLWVVYNSCAGVFGVAFGTFLVKDINAGERPSLTGAWRQIRPLAKPLARLFLIYLARQLLTYLAGAVMIAAPLVAFRLTYDLEAVQPFVLPLACALVAAALLLIALTTWLLITLVTDFFWAPVFLSLARSTATQSWRAAAHQARGRRRSILSALGWIMLPHLLVLLVFSYLGISSLAGIEGLNPEHFSQALNSFDSRWWHGAGATLSFLLAPAIYLLPAALAAERVPHPTQTEPAAGPPVDLPRPA